MSLKLSLFALVAGVALFVSGCAGLTGPNGLGQRVLVVCKVTPAQQAAAQNLSNQYFSQVASGKKARPGRRYVALQTLDPNAKQLKNMPRPGPAPRKKPSRKASRLAPSGPILRSCIASWFSMS